MRGDENILEYIDITSEDIKNLKNFSTAISGKEDSIFDRFYMYKLSFPEFERFFRDKEHLNYVRNKQITHLRSLLSGRLDAEYFRRSGRIGEVHYRIGLSMGHYMAAYYWLIDSVLREYIKQREFSPVFSFLRVAFIDMIATSTGYIEHWEKAIESVNELKADVLANVSHEILTPVTMIKGFSEIALESEDIDDIKGYIRRMREHVLRLEEITSNLVEATKGRVEINLEEFSLRVLIEDILGELRGLSARSGVEIITEINVDKVHTDRYKLRVILWNIISNAIKFNKPGGKVWIRTYTSDSRTVIEVEDTGVGFQKDKLPEIFKPLTQLHPETSRAYSGIGIGMYVAKKYVEALKGKIDVESSPGKGTIVRIWI